MPPDLQKQGDLLRLGQVVLTATAKQPCKIDRFIAGGGQGEVYVVTLGGQPMALKWYFPHTATREQYESLTRLAASGPPGKSDEFLWPLELAVADKVPGFGYLMRLREQRYIGILDLLQAKVDPPFRVLATAALRFVEAFRMLHAAGLCYRDISFGNGFFDPKTGEVLVCDNDNVAPNRSATGAVLGTPDFMAPEIVRLEATPDRQSDLHSLAVLLFYMFHIHHPLYGRRLTRIKVLDASARAKLCGEMPLFIFDPKDKSNEALDDGEAGANAKRYWPMYPPYFRDTFTRAFTDGLRDRDHGRVTEGEWRDVLVRLRDGIFYCYCSPEGIENFFDPQKHESNNGDKPVCSKCKKKVQLPFRLQLGRNCVILTHTTKLFPHHVDRRSSFDFSAPAGEVVRNPKNPNFWGLKNLTRDAWMVDEGDGKLKAVQPGQIAVLKADLKINFGQVSGTILF